MSKYDLVRSHIDFTRQSLRETSDDSEFTDEQIYVALLEARGLILERRLEKHKELPEDIYQTICIKLCLAPYAECEECFGMPADCMILKTTDDIPTGLFDGNLELIRVTTLTGREIAPSTEPLHRVRVYRKTGKNNYYYFRMKDKLGIFNVPFNRLKAIKVKGIFLDPVAAQEVNSCVESCTDLLDAKFGTRVSDRIEIREEAIKVLLRTKQMPEDLSNNAESVVPNQII